MLCTESSEVGREKYRAEQLIGKFGVGDVVRGLRLETKSRIFELFYLRKSSTDCNLKKIV